jgi:hypothetical protein
MKTVAGEVPIDGLSEPPQAPLAALLAGPNLLSRHIEHRSSEAVVGCERTTLACLANECFEARAVRLPYHSPPRYR